MIYLNMDECWLTSMPQQRFKLQISFNYDIIPENGGSERVVVTLQALKSTASMLPMYLLIEW